MCRSETDSWSSSLKIRLTSSMTKLSGTMSALVIPEGVVVGDRLGNVGAHVGDHSGPSGADGQDRKHADQAGGPAQAAED